MKKVFKKAISILLVAVMVFGAAPLAGFVGLELPELNLFGTKAEAATSGTCGENLTWTLDTETGELVINGTGEMSGWSSTSPWYNYGSSIKSVTIGNGVTNIKGYAFYACSNLESVTIPDSVTTIGGQAFYDCVSLISVTIGNGVTTIDAYAFIGCTSLENVYYLGTPEQWALVTVNVTNNYLICNPIFEHNSQRPYHAGTCGDNLTWKLYTDGAAARVR